jgi:hypothetical protein
MSPIVFTGSPRSLAQIDRIQDTQVSTIGLLLILLFTLNGSLARADIVSRALGCNGDPCVVEDSAGGKVSVFQEAGYAVDKGARTLVIIDGLCASACVLFADIARRKVCITEWAMFGFHHYTAPAWRTGKDGQAQWRSLRRATAHLPSLRAECGYSKPKQGSCAL